jgi:UDP-glucose:(heptosyl)LPS alpha-1,3-glucosyltransferase
VREEVLANYPVAPERVVVIPNGVDVRRFHPRLREERRAEVRRRYTLGEEEFLVLFLGTGFRRKGLDTAIAAVAAIPGTQRVRLLVGGRGDVQEWRRLARRLKALDRVLFLGPVDRPEDLYAASDVLVLPTRYDPFPNVVLEAMACGLPVVTTRAAGVVDLLRDGEDALVIESAEEPHRLEAALRRLMDPAVAARIGNAARATAERHSLDRFASDYLRVFGAAGS